MMTYGQMKELERQNGCAWYVSEENALCANAICRVNLEDVRIVCKNATIGEPSRVVVRADIRGVDNAARDYDVDATWIFADKAQAARFVLNNLNEALPPKAGLPEELVGVEEERELLSRMANYEPSVLSED